MGTTLSYPSIKISKKEANLYDKFNEVRAHLLSKGPFKKVERQQLISRTYGKNYVYAVSLDDQLFALKISFESEQIDPADMPRSSYTLQHYKSEKLTTKSNQEITYSVLELLPGNNLEKTLLDEEEALVVLWGCSKVLLAMHREHIMHKNIRPGTIFKRCDNIYVLCADYEVSTQKDSAQQGGPLYIAPEVQTVNYSYAADVYALGMTMKDLVPEEKRSAEFSALLDQLTTANPDERPTPSKILHHRLVKARRLRILQQIMRDFNQIMKTIKDLDQSTKEAREVKNELKMLLDDMQMVAPSIEDMITLLEEKNQLPPLAEFPKQEILVQKVNHVGHCLQRTKDKLTSVNGKLSDLDTKLNDMRKPLYNIARRGKLVGMAVGGPGGLVAGGGFGAGLIAAPILGASGAFIVAGIAFPPALVIAGAAFLIGGLSLGLGKIIADAVQKKNVMLLSQIGQVLKAVHDIQTIHQDLKESVDRAINVLDHPNIRLNAEKTGSAPKTLREEKEKWSGFSTKLDAVQLQQIDTSQDLFTLMDDIHRVAVVNESDANHTGLTERGEPRKEISQDEISDPEKTEKGSANPLADPLPLSVNGPLKLDEDDYVLLDNSSAGDMDSLQDTAEQVSRSAPASLITEEVCSSY